MTQQSRSDFVPITPVHGHPARAGDVRRHNLALLVHHISEGGGVTRAELSRMTRLTKGTISSLVQELIDRELLVELAAEPQGRLGRPPSGVLALNGDSHCGIGIEINVDYIAVSVADLLRRVRFHKVATKDNRTVKRSTVLRRAAELADEAIAAATAAGLKPSGLALAVPGPVDVPRGVLIRAPNLDWSDVAIVSELRRFLPPFGLPVLAENEANLAALGELWLGVGPEGGDYIHVSGEIGVGGGIIVGGSLFRGARGSAGEIGHIVVDPDGPVCSCGGRGCLERLAGQEALFELAGLPLEAGTRLGASKPPLQELLMMLALGNRKATGALERVAHALGLALADVVNMIDPDTIILGGIYAPLSPWLIEPLSSTLSRQAVLGLKKPVSVRASQLGPDAAVRGAATWVVQRVLTGTTPPPDPPQPHPRRGRTKAVT